MIPVCQPFIGAEETDNVLRCMDSGWISGGDYVGAFEKKWATYCRRKHGVAVSNGTVALQLALQALEIPAGSEIIIPSFTIISCALAALHNNLTPVFVDVEPDTGCIDASLIEDHITERTKAIMPVHMYGHPVDMDAVMGIAKRHNLYVVEDAAQAHGAEYLDSEQTWRRCGSFGDVSCFSFYSNKIVTTGEGGMVLTNSSELDKKLRSLRNLCFGAGDSRFVHTGIGHNFRMTNLQAAIGVAQIDKIEEVVRRKRKMAEMYSMNLQHPKIKLPTQKFYANSVYWMYGIQVEDPVKLAAKLLHHEIESRPFFTGLHTQKVICSEHPNLLVTEYLAKHGLYLPSGVQLTESDIEFISKVVLEAV